MIKAEDRLGNKLYQSWWAVFLFLSWKGTRKLWDIFEWDLYVKRKNKHIFAKLNAYWFNNMLLLSLDPDKKIYLQQEDKSVLEITVKQAIDKWKYMNFSKDWFELQKFVPITEFTFRT